MNNWLYTFYFMIVAAFAILTGEVVTFVMLGVILLTLTNMNRTLKEISEKLSK